MRWVAFGLVVVVALTFQSTLAPRLELWSARPDWLLVLVVFVALHAPRRDGLIAAWVIGLTADLLTVERLGLLALSYTLVALAVGSIKEALFREKLTTPLLVTLFAGLLLQSGWLIYRRLMYEPMSPWQKDALSGALWASLYTAAWVPVCYPIWRCAIGVMGLARLRNPFAGPAALRRMENPGV